LIQFLTNPRPDVRQVASSYIVGFTHPTSDNFDLVVSRADKIVRPLLVMCHDNPVVAHDAIRSLVNLTTKPSVCAHFDDEDSLSMIVRLITNPSMVIADLCCMLLSNLTKIDRICHRLSTLVVGETPGLCSSPLAMDQLTDVFVKGMDNKFNKDANYGFLASVFSDMTTYPFGRKYFLERTSYDGKLPITKIMVFNEYPDIIRRGGVDSTMKNVCFEKDKHREILDPKETNMLPYILLPLCGPEEIEMDDMEKFPDELQLLGDDKQRESDPKLRATLLEAINLLCTTYFGRQTLRDKNAYAILREMHKVEKDDMCIDLNDRAVQLLMRDESKETMDDSLQANAMDDDTIEEI
ncbi:Protein hgh1, partial [Linderina macrospora]